MSILTVIENVIRRLDREATAELSDLKAEFEAKVSEILPVLVTLENDIKTAAAQAEPGIRAAVEAAVTAAEDELRRILGI